MKEFDITDDVKFAEFNEEGFQGYLKDKGYQGLSED